MAAVKATGTITCGTDAAATDGDSVTIGDGINPAVTYEYDKSVNGVAGGHKTWLTGTTADGNSLALRTLILANQPAFSVVDALGVLTLTNNWPGLGGNVTITKSGTGAVSAVTGMSGGLSAVATTITASTTVKLHKIERRGIKIQRVTLNLPAGLVQDASNYATFQILKGASVAYSWSTQTTTGQGTITADTAVDLVASGTVANLSLADGDQLSFAIIIAGTTTVPSGIIVIEGHEL